MAHGQGFYLGRGTAWAMDHRAIPRPTALLVVLALMGHGAVRGQPPTDPLVCLDSCASCEKRGDARAALRFAQQAVDLARRSKDRGTEGAALLKAGALHHRSGDLSQALEHYLAALLAHEDAGDLDGQAEALNHIGAVHHYDRNYERAGEYYRRSLEIRRAQGDPAKLALPYNNLGSLLEDSGRPDSALHYHRAGLALRRARGDSTWVGIILSHIGACHDQLGRMDSALYHLRRAERMMATHGSPSMQGATRRMLGSTCVHAGLYAEARRWCTDALRTARAVGDHYLEQESCECLHQALDHLSDHAAAYTMLARFTALRDSMFGAERAKERTRMDLTHEFDRKLLADSIVNLQRQQQAELAYQQRLVRERDQKRLYLYGGIAVLLLAGGLWNRLITIRRSRNLVQRERERSEQLLRNILPAPIAEELKEHGRAQAREVADVSILFTDFHDFTRFSERMDAQQLVGEIDTCFKAFDAICLRHGLEKIKTIGDAYMAAGGLPQPWPGSAAAAVRAALDMQQWLEQRAAERHAGGAPAFRMRAGIHTGPVVAGIVGATKFQYDVWGDTVNIAARMESSGEVGRVNISAATRTCLAGEPDLHIVARGQQHVKGKGELEMFFVHRSFEGA